MTYFLENTKSIKKQKIDSVVITGMGGSGLVGDIIRFISKDTGIKTPLFSSKEYNASEPDGFKKTLFLFSSFSGNTRETISAFSSALKKKKMVGIITGQKNSEIARLAQKNKTPVCIFEGKHLTPRDGLVYNINATIKLLSVFLGIKENLVSEEVCMISQGAFTDTAKKIGNRIPLLYTECDHVPLAQIWKVFLNETAKIPAFVNSVPEIAHNEIEGLAHAKDFFVPMFLFSQKTMGENRIKMRALSTFFKKIEIPSFDLPIKGKTRKEIFLYAFSLARETTEYIAKKNKINPHTTPIIDIFKKDFEK